ncbi:hypothetical protein N7448_000796 [Penicillium atrosanguineum]|uniref:RanBP2-type domain-containing protein n=1 Tax=Penicillium atrosanguineum TaxID=1132637 RepID=A0A9W9LBE3_9EURO|nr:Molybdenum cofactor biosynthesis MoeB [Penicillium atrosanguineum]KAJ5134182.1 hypothetical protein N7526_005547 [Penicillium atrosanguineum]KAJ5149218.1 hypothetical protein N7448_000796 [Penicillium atrosanguineum]KAJ5304531.1 Molybdenum cofactor biosynthesis MoeB [Penicillium atrosanguineum]KAJ5324001.1 hypothetical protein N7476_002601 [Penicillium atrosanguineum]
MASLWYCCDCSFGPHNAALYDSCVNCQRRRCVECVEEKAADGLNTHNHAHCHESSPYPSVASFNPVRPMSHKTMPAIPTPDLPGVRPLYRAAPALLATSLGATTNYYTETYMYICCNCNDGPKVFNVQPVCVVCNHVACDSCTNVK